MISKSLKTNTTLTTLDLDGEKNEVKENDREEETDRKREMKRNDRNETWTDNNIGDEGARMISESLKTNTTLTELNLKCDEIEWNEMNIMR